MEKEAVLQMSQEIVVNMAAFCRTLDKRDAALAEQLMRLAADIRVNVLAILDAHPTDEWSIVVEVKGYSLYEAYTACLRCVELLDKVADAGNKEAGRFLWDFHALRLAISEYVELAT